MVPHNTVLIHKQSRRAYLVIHPSVRCPDNKIRTGAIDIETGVLIYVDHSLLNDYDQMTRMSYEARKNKTTSYQIRHIPEMSVKPFYRPDLDNERETKKEPPKKVLFDELEEGDIIVDVREKESVKMSVLFIDRITGYVTVSKNKSNEPTTFISRNNIIQYYTRVGKMEAKKPYVLNIVRVLETRVYEHLYDETWIDRYYRNYCNKRGRFDETEELVSSEEHVFIVPDQLYLWLKENIPKDDIVLLKKLLNDDNSI